MREQTHDISETDLAGIMAMAKLAESRDLGMEKHLKRVRTFCRMLAERLGERPRYGSRIGRGFAEDIYYASPLHDIGKAVIPESILVKRGRLTSEEFAIMQSHADCGARTLEAIREEYPDSAILRMGIDISRHHHERWDGSGYPCRLAGESIPLAARIMAVAAVYDALRSDRCSQPAYSHPYSRDVIVSESGSHFDPDMVEAFVELEEAFRESRERMD